MHRRTPAPTIKSILLDDSLHATRLLIALGSLTWALLLFWPGELFTPDRSTYRLMAQVAPEVVWGLAFLAHSCWALYTLLTRVRNHVTLAMDAFLGCLLWTGSTLLCFAAHWPGQIDGFLNQLMHYPMPAAMSGELWMAVASWWHLVRYWAEDESHK